MSTIPWGTIAIVLFSLAGAALLAWAVIAMAESVENAPTGIDRMLVCIEAGGSWYWKNDWVGYVCEKTR